VQLSSDGQCADFADDVWVFELLDSHSCATVAFLLTSWLSTSSLSQGLSPPSTGLDVIIRTSSSAGAPLCVYIRWSRIPPSDGPNVGGAPL
jgi:hypothetical protein